MSIPETTHPKQTPRKKRGLAREPKFALVDHGHNANAANRTIWRVDAKSERAAEPHPHSTEREYAEV